MRTLLLLRHATAVSVTPGRHDSERPLSEIGLSQASAVGELLRASGQRLPSLVISSPALRTSQTAEALLLDCPVITDARLYNAGSDTILQVLTEVDNDPDTILVVGHAPGIPALAHDLADPATSDESAIAAIEHGYPPATLCRLTVDTPWSELRSAALVEAVPGRR